MRLCELGEFGLLAELERRGLVSHLTSEGVHLGDLALTQDGLVEGVHFRREWISWRDLGYKAAAVNLSDLAAMAAEPDALLVSLTLPRETELEAVIELYEGLNEPGFAVRGGDTNAAETASVTVTAVGRTDRVPGRGGARPGDALVVTGPLGGSAAGLHALAHGVAGFDELVRAHRRPPLRLREGQRLATIARAVIDLSDGIASDAERIAERSGCKLVIEVERLPLAPRIDEVADLPFWTMGEDYELLAAVPAEAVGELAFPIVGRCEEGAGVELRLHGDPYDAAGWEHFRR